MSALAPGLRGVAARNQKDLGKRRKSVKKGKYLKEFRQSEWYPLLNYWSQSAMVFAPSIFCLSDLSLRLDLPV